MDLVDLQSCDTSFSGESGQREDGALALVGGAEIVDIQMGLCSLSIVHRIVDSPHQGMSPQTHLEKLKIEEDPGCVTTTLSALMETALAGLTMGTLRG